MSDRDALLRAICENPDDDAPRLIYADWLDEHGDPLQAEFIRIQVELSMNPRSTQRKHHLRERQVALWRQLRKWRYLIGDWTQWSLSNFDRGFETKCLTHWLDAQNSTAVKDQSDSPPSPNQSTR